MTGQQCVNAALTILGVLTQGESPASAESTDALQALNDMLASWSVEKFNVYSVSPAAYTLVSGTASYTIGSSGTFNTTRPVRIERASILMENPHATGKISFPVTIVNDQQWLEIGEREAKAAIPTILHDDGGFPLRTLRLWPKPEFTGTAPQLELWTWTQLQTFADLSTNYTFPPGYDRALKFNLAVEVAAMFGIVPTPQVVQIAAEAKAALRMLNAAEPGAIPAAGQVSAVVPPSGGGAA